MDYDIQGHETDKYIFMFTTILPAKSDSGVMFY